MEGTPTGGAITACLASPRDTEGVGKGRGSGLRGVVSVFATAEREPDGIEFREAATEATAAPIGWLAVQTESLEAPGMRAAMQAGQLLSRLTQLAW
jgi:hypothetical protein